MDTTQNSNASTTQRARTRKLTFYHPNANGNGTAVEIEKMDETGDVTKITAVIYCEKASHKGIIIGKNGTMLKKISTMARADCEKFMGTKVFLTTWVKVKENWRDSDFLVRNFGYSE